MFSTKVVAKIEKEHLKCFRNIITRLMIDWIDRKAGKSRIKSDFGLEQPLLNKIVAARRMDHTQTRAEQRGQPGSLSGEQLGILFFFL